MGAMASPSDDARLPRRPGHPSGVDSLLLDVTTITVDPAYLEAAARRPAGRTQRPGPVLLVVLVLLGLLLAVAARQTRQAAPAAQRARDALAAEARERTDRSDELQRRLDDLRREADTMRDRGLETSTEGTQLAAQLATLDLLAAAVEVSGPGVEVTLRDAEAGRGDQDLTGDGRVRDRDIQEVVNALWAAGGEAIAINGQRLSSLTAIREAGEAVLVDYRPVSPPYVVSVVGDPDVVEPAFTDSAAAAAFRTLRELYGIGFEVKRRSRIALPAAALRLQHATVPGSRLLESEAPR